MKSKSKDAIMAAIVASTLMLGQLSLLSADTPVPGSKEDPVVTVSYLNSAMSSLKKEILSSIPATPAPVKPPAKPPVVSPKVVKGTVTATSLNIRKGPSTSYQSIYSLTKGKVVTILSTSGTWYKIQYGSVVGYVNAPYIKK